jgi:hypothetical protein
VNLALHPNCGTNLLTSAGMVAASLWFYIQLLQARRKVNWADFSTFVLIGLVALVLSRPLGMWLQRHVTTKADLENLTLLSVKTIRLDLLGRRVALHFVSTVGSDSAPMSKPTPTFYIFHGNDEFGLSQQNPQDEGGYGACR